MELKGQLAQLRGSNKGCVNSSGDENRRSISGDGSHFVSVGKYSLNNRLERSSYPSELSQ